MSLNTKIFSIDPMIWQRYPGMKLVCVMGSGLDNTLQRQEIDERLIDSQSIVFETLRNVNLNEFAPFKEWRNVQPGNKFPAAHEALGQRVAARKTIRSISPLVDAYNSVSIEMLEREIGAPIGAWSMDSLPGLYLGITKGGESFTELGKNKAVIVKEGETAYSHPDSCELITRHFVWRQSLLGSIQPTTKSFFMVCELIKPFAQHAETMQNELMAICSQLSVTKTKSVVLSEADDFSWNFEE